VEILCCVSVCESVSLRRSLAEKQVWSPNPQVHGELTWSRVNPKRASGPGSIWTHYGHETPKSSQGERLEKDKASGDPV
jgi:hypothetical protein